MKGDSMLKVLEIIADTANGFVDIIDALLSSGYGASYSKLQYEISKRENAGIGREQKRLERINYLKIISRLKKDGLLKIKPKGNGKLISLTKLGKLKLDFLKKKKQEELPKFSSPVEKGDHVIIVAFDIPERERKKRDWLRTILEGMGLHMIQKSVWMGKIKLPEEFLNSLHDLNIIHCVEIFEISKTGTLKHIS